MLDNEWVLRFLKRSLVVALLLPTLLACGGDDSDDAARQLDAGALLGSASTAVQGVRSLHFRLSHENGTTPIPLNLELVSAEGDVIVPDRVSADVRAKAGPLTANVDVIGVGDRTWITNPFSRRWEVLRDASIQDIADPTALVTALLSSIREPDVVGSEQVDGVQTHRVRGVLDSGALRSALPAARDGYPVTADIWLGVDDSLPRRARIAGALSAGEPKNIVRQLDISRYNQPVTIQPPE